MATCGGLAAGAVYDCDSPIIPGVRPRLVLMNLDQVTATKDISNKRLITDMTIVGSGNAAYAFEGIRQSVTPESNFIPQNFTVGYDHQLSFFVFDISSTQKLNLEKMALGKMVAIVENRNAVGNADSIFEVFGYGVGMEVTELQRINNDLESGGAYRIILKTSDNEGKESTLPLSFFDTDYATTLAKVDLLLTPVP